MKATRLYIPVLVLLAALPFAIDSWMVEGSSVAAPDALAWDQLGQNDAPSDWMDSWMWHQEAPYKYRILGKLPVWLCWKLSAGTRGGDPLVWFVAWGFLCLLATLFALRHYLRHLMESARASRPDALALAGCLLFVLAPPALFAFKFPLHTTPNDLLGYFLVTLGLSAAIRNQARRMCLVSCAGVFCRETALLVPFAFLLTSPDPWRKRLAWSAAPLLCWGALRVLWWEPYRPVEGGLYNLIHPWETLCFLFLLFAPFWPVMVAGWARARRLARQEPQWRAFTRILPWAASLLFLVTLLLARVRELRVLFVLFPFVLPLVLVWWSSDGAHAIRTLRRKRTMILAGVVLAIVIWMRSTLVATSREQALAVWNQLRHFYGGYGKGWLDIAYAYLFLTLIALILVLSARRPEAPPAR